MPQSTNVTANQMRNIPEQAAEAAATNHGKEQTRRTSAPTKKPSRPKSKPATKYFHNTVHEQALHHGKAAQK